MTTGMAAAFFSFGGVGYAVHAVQTAVTGSGGQTASDDQYAFAAHRVREPARADHPAGRPHAAGHEPQGRREPRRLLPDREHGRRRRAGHRPGSGTAFGPYPGGTAIKYTQAPGKTPNEKKYSQHQRPGRRRLDPHHGHGRLRRSSRWAAARRRPAWYLHLRSDSSAASPARGGGGPPMWRPARPGIRHAPVLHVLLG